MNIEPTTEQLKIEPEAGATIENVHNATVKTSLLYNKQLAKPGHTWFIYRFVKRLRTLVVKKNKKDFIKEWDKPIQGGVQVRSDFVKEHGEANVANMIIVNIVNKIKTNGRNKN